MERRTAWLVLVERITVVEIAVIEVVVVEAVIKIVTIDDRSAVRDVGVVVVDHSVAMPVASPVMPAPAVPSEKSDSEADSKSNPYSAQKDPRHGIPTRVCNDRVAVHEPRIVRGHIDHVRIGWFDDNGVALRRYLLLLTAVQVAGLASLLTHQLDSIRHILLLVGVCVPERRSPGKVLVHIFKNRRKLREGFHTGVPRLFVDFFCQLFTFEVGVTLDPAVRLDNFSRISGSSENLCNERVRVQGDGGDELLQLLRGLLRRPSRQLIVGLTHRTERFGLRSESQ